MESTAILGRGLIQTLIWLLAFACAPTVFLGIEWSVAYQTLGHAPIPSIDDPKYISSLSGVLHTATFFVLLGSVPAQLVTLGLYIRSRPSLRHLFATIAAFVFLAIGTFALFGRATPDDLMTWWFD